MSELRKVIESEIEVYQAMKCLNTFTAACRAAHIGRLQYFLTLLTADLEEIRHPKCNCEKCTGLAIESYYYEGE